MAFSVQVTVHEGSDIAPAKYLVHGYDDILWTDDASAAAQYVAAELARDHDG